jgi:hypothetical protein
MFLTELARPGFYENEIETLRLRHARGKGGEALTQQGFDLGTATGRDRALARLLARTVGSGSYRFGPVEARSALIDGKRRTLYRACLTDTIVLGVLARVLARRIDPFLSDRVYSYRPGGSPWKAIADLAAYLHQHRSQLPDRRQRGLYVIRRDIKSYGEAIPASDESRLWPLLGEAVKRGDATAPDDLDAFLRSALRPRVQTRDGQLLDPERGIPTGSPVQPLICNLYLTPVDCMADAVPGAFYARFGDDILFAHPDATVAREAAGRIDEAITGLDLQIKEEKKAEIYFTGPGRPSEQWPESRPLSLVEYLGCRVGFDGLTGLKAEKARRFILHMRGRLRHTNTVLDGAPLPERAAALCEVVNRSLDPGVATSDRAAAFLRHIATDRRQLCQLDFLIALEVASLLSGRRGVRAFRRVRYRELRQRYGLVSLVRERNRRARRRAEGSS